jgi:hypothetical protein
LDAVNIRHLEDEAMIADRQDALQTQVRLLEHYQRQREKAAGMVKTVFSGWVKWVRF